MRATHVSKFQVLQVAISKLQQVKWSKDRDGFVFVVKSVWGPQLHMTEEKTSVQKPLLSAGDVTNKGHALWFGRKRWLHHPKDSPNLTAMRTCFRRVCEQHSWNGAIDLTKERGVYNLCVQVAGGDGSIEQAVDASPMKWRSMSQVILHRRAFGW